MYNPFPKPDSGDPNLKIVISWVQHMINSPRGLHFHDCLDKVKEYVDKKDVEMALVAAHCTVNVINNQNIDEAERTDIITGLNEQIEQINKD